MTVGASAFTSFSLRNHSYVRHLTEFMSLTEPRELCESHPPRTIHINEIYLAHTAFYG